MKPVGSFTNSLLDSLKRVYLTKVSYNYLYVDRVRASGLGRPIISSSCLVGVYVCMYLGSIGVGINA